MKKLISKNWKVIIKFSVVLLVLSYFSITLSNWLRMEATQDKLNHAGAIGPLLVYLYVVLSHIFAPVAGTPGSVIAFSAYGFWGGWLILYVASITSAAINFYISRELGRKWVKKFAGEESLDKIDNFADVLGIKLLKIARIFGAPLYEFVSYAAGFTRISFKKYMLITVLYSIVPGILFAIFIYNSLDSVFALMVFFAGMFLFGALFSWYAVNKYIKTKGK